MFRPLITLIACAALAAPLIVPLGCTSSNGTAGEVVVYCALDAEFSLPLLNDFELASGIDVLELLDSESTKTVGLVNRIKSERGRPRCDVFWNNEILNTLRLEKQGLLDVYVSPSAAAWPTDYRSPAKSWYGLAARARVLIVNTKLVPADERPTSIHDLVDPRWKGKCGFARPLYGTTASHAAVLFDRWGDEKAREFFLKLKENAKVLSGNKQVALEVGNGQLAFGLTDTDDAIIERDNGQPVDFIFPDQGEGQMGALFIPNTIAIVRRGPNRAQAEKLIDHLLKPEVEKRLAEGSSAQFPVNPAVAAKSRAAPREAVRWMKVDFRSAAEKWNAAAGFMREQFP